MTTRRCARGREARRPPARSRSSCTPRRRCRTWPIGTPSKTVLPQQRRRFRRRRRRAGGPQRRRRRDGRRAGGPRGGPAATVSADRPRERAPAAAGHDEPAAASDDGTASAAVRAHGPTATDVRAGSDGAASEDGRPRQRAPAATGPARPVRRRRRQRARDPGDDDLRRVTYVLILVKLRHHDVGRRHGPPPDHVDTHTRDPREGRRRAVDGDVLVKHNTRLHL